MSSRGDLAVSAGVTIPASDLSWEATRSSGPGGQNVNKVSSKVRLRFSASESRALDERVRERLVALAGPGGRTADGDVVIVSSLTRDRDRNLLDARSKLITMIRRALVEPTPRVKTAPSSEANALRVSEKRKRGAEKAARSARTNDEP